MKKNPTNSVTADTLPPRNPPSGFVTQIKGSTTCILRCQWEEELLASGILTGGPGSTPMGQTALPGGRGSVSIITLPNVGAVVLRRYRRGGLIGKVLVDRYLSGTRPFRELSVLALARARGVPVPDAMGASSIRVGILWHRGRIATRLIPGARTLPVFIEKNRGNGALVARVLEGAGKAIRRMHEAGIDHADLNMNNVLVDDNDVVHIIDFDKAVFCRRLGLRWRIRNLRRLLRSLRKLKAAGRLLEEGDFAEIIRGYTADDPALSAVIEKKTLRSRLLALRSAAGKIF
ncbi:MAG: 3-deoxy-D-manno-octulosonic acid kinase [Deltaproteobacteria bacterium]|nr:3-deoxy-D-manno-octulosonic acid kinase [Candidatus Zymogenaceae bacterium]